MSEPHAEPPAADVRSFLPRPGEPVEDYAARLRALHHDLTLVLDAVERGLAAAEAEAEGPVPVARAPLREAEELPEPRRSPPPPGPLSAPRGGARVEVISTPRAPGDEERGDRAWSGPHAPEGEAPWGSGRGAQRSEGAPARGEPAAPSPARWSESEPWVERRPPEPRAAPWQDEAWSPRGWPTPPEPPAAMSYEPPPHAPYTSVSRRRAPALPPVAVAAALLGWLVALALALAFAFGL